MQVLIKEEFKQKKKFAHLLLFLQLIILIITCIGIFFWRSQGKFYSLDDLPFHYYWLAVFQSNSDLVLLADFAFAIVSSCLNEKINLSQTWRLIPVSDAKLWLSNLFSSILTCVYLLLLQLGLLFITALPASLHLAFHNPLRSTLSAFALYPSKSDWLCLLNRILFIFALAFFVYICVSLVDFMTQAIVASFLLKDSKWIRILVMLVLTLIMVIIAADAWWHFASFMLRQSHLHSAWTGQFGSPLWLSNLLVWGTDLVLAGLDLWLLNHFVESKTDH